MTNKCEQIKHEFHKFYIRTRFQIWNFFNFKLIITSWEIASKFDQEFNKIFSIFSNMRTCTICDIIKSYKFSHTIKKIPNIFNLYNIPTKRLYCITKSPTFEDGCKMFICTTCN
jgi:hypothetical protein